MIISTAKAEELEKCDELENLQFDIRILEIEVHAIEYYRAIKNN